jgi:uncharacterized protein YvpB
MGVIGWLVSGEHEGLIFDERTSAGSEVYSATLGAASDSTSDVAISQVLNPLLQEAGTYVTASQQEVANVANAGWHVVDDRRQYYLRDGSMAKGAVESDGVAFTFDDQGYWVSSRLDVPYISQLPDMPFGCEVTAATMMLNYAGVDVNKADLAEHLPHASTPDRGFTGSVYGLQAGSAYGGIIWPSALLGLVQGYRESAVDLTGASWADVRRFIDEGKPVCVWIVVSGVGDHTVLLTGYSDFTVWLNDPLVDKDVEVDLDTFLARWRQNGYRALSY